MKARMRYDGGPTSDGRIVKGKYISFKAALDNSYQAEWITFKGKKYRCLINPDKMTVDYDQKIISIDYDAGMQNGDVFYWDRTGKHWIVFLQRFEEEAYFRATIRECDYQINGYWCYIRGPVETALIWRQKHKVEFNEMNYSILAYVTSNEETNDYFTRFRIVKFEGHNWRVAAVDRYSQPGLIEVYLEEWFDNEMEDDIVQPKIDKPRLDEVYIEGPQFIKPYDTNISFSIVNNEVEGIFVVDSSKVKIVKTDNQSCLVDVLTGRSTKFNLIYKDNNDTIITSKEVTVESF